MEWQLRWDRNIAQYEHYRQGGSVISGTALGLIVGFGTALLFAADPVVDLYSGHWIEIVKAFALGGFIAAVCFGYWRRILFYRRCALRHLGILATLAGERPGLSDGLDRPADLDMEFRERPILITALLLGLCAIVIFT